MFIIIQGTTNDTRKTKMNQKAMKALEELNQEELRVKAITNGICPDCGERNVVKWSEAESFQDKLSPEVWMAYDRKIKHDNPLCTKCYTVFGPFGEAYHPYRMYGAGTVPGFDRENYFDWDFFSREYHSRR